MENHSKNIKIFTGNSHPELAREIAKALNIPLGKAEVSTFSDGEIYFNYSGCYYDNNTRFRLHTF